MASEIDLKMTEIPADKFGYPGMTAQVFYVDYEDSMCLFTFVQHILLNNMIMM